jgi:hypothetical protein
MRLILLAVIFLPLFINAQNAIIAIVSDNYKNPVFAAYVVNIHTGEHTHTDLEGKFILNSNASGDSIIISHFAYNKFAFQVNQHYLDKENSLILSDKEFDLSEVVVKNDVQSVNVISQIALQTKPVNSSQELLPLIPGLIIGQHAGGGKAEQIFLRGFDLDHGTDINITVDGLPVNMVSHAHGQGYADLHFLIPETVKNVDFGLGPYFADKGNFSTAGYVDFITQDNPEYSSIGVEYGSFNSLRFSALFDLLDKVPNHHAYLAAEYNLSDGPFESPQNFSRLNFFGKYSFISPQGNKMSLQASYFRSRWDASGQIPQRAVDNNIISRFGALDDNEGGETDRSNVLLKYSKILDPNTSVKSSFYYSNYNFQLFSNFTFFLNDSINGDQIKQFENRNLFGGQSEINRIWQFNDSEIQLKGGFSFRYDDINNNELSHTKNRSLVLNYLKYGNVDESNAGLWADFKWSDDKWLFNLGIRADYFNFSYQDLLDVRPNSNSASGFVLSPKLNLLFKPNSKCQFYFKSGIGFHSNDSRVSVDKNTDKILPLSFATDLGLICKPFPKLLINAAIWSIFSEQELVYVGDEAVVEPGTSSIRAGIDLAVNLQVLKFLFLNANVNYAYARSAESPEGANYIPLAPNLTTTGGLTFKHSCGLSSGFHYRYVNDRPANEFNTLTAKGYFVADANVGYLYKSFFFGVDIRNLFNAQWDETQFATESRLKNESQSVEEIHFTPGAPFSVSAKVQFRF